jgi:hypothetical protein
MTREEWSFWDGTGTWRTPSVAIAMIIYSIFLMIFVYFWLKKYLSRDRSKRKYLSIAIFFFLSAWLINILAQLIENIVLNKIKGWIGLHLFWGAPLDVIITILLPLLPPAVLGFVMLIRSKCNQGDLNDI